MASNPSWLERVARVLERVGPSSDDWLNTRDSAMAGTWAYLAGTSGSVSVPTGGRVLAITAQADNAAGHPHTITINGGTAIPIPSDSALTLQPRGNLVAPGLVFTGTIAYFVEYVS